MPTLNLWAKTNPVHPLLCHLLDVGHTALALLQTPSFAGIVPRWARATGLPIEQVPAWLAYLAALHDLGKARAEFQAKGPQEILDILLADGLPEPALLHGTAESQSYRHEAGTAEWLIDHLEGLGWDIDAAVHLATAIRGHHGDFGAETPQPETPQQHERWEPLRERLHVIVEQTFAPAKWNPSSLPDPSTAGLLLAGLTVLADWISSNHDLFRYHYHQESVGEYISQSQAQAASAIERLGLATTLPWPSPATFRAIFPAIDKPRPLQIKLEELVQEGLPPGLAIIEAPMGEGKSEAAIYLATQWHAGGIYLALPTMATSNQMYERYREFLEQHDPVAAKGTQLVHGMAWLLDEVTPDHPPDLPDDEEVTRELALDWFRPAKRSLFAMHGVGTVDQVMKGALHIRHGFLRLFALTGKVLVIDEIHAYDRYMLRILTILLRWCGHLHIPVILLSATLPQSRRTELVDAYHPGIAPSKSMGGTTPYPLLTHLSGNGHLREVSIDPSDRRLRVRLNHHYGLLTDASATAKLALSLAKKNRCVCVIANTVVRAQRIYRELLRYEDEVPDLLLFHARFPADERRIQEMETLRRFDKRSLLSREDARYAVRPERAILVSTQVVEQSLDVDFDAMISDLAPVDLLLQRTGRLHRHDRGIRPEAELHICHPSDGGTDYGKVYHAHIQWLTQQALQERHAWELPTEIRRLVENVYHAVDSPFRQEWLEAERAYEANARACLIPPPRSDRFSLGDLRLGMYEDNEESTQAYIVARTRAEDDSVRVLLVEDQDWVPLLTARRPPPKEVLQRIYLRTVNLPKWWLTPAVAVGPRWLPGIRILRLKGGCWEGLTGRGCHYTIVAHPVFGVIRLEGDEAW